MENHESYSIAEQAEGGTRVPPIFDGMARISRSLVRLDSVSWMSEQSGEDRTENGTRWNVNLTAYNRFRQEPCHDEVSTRDMDEAAEFVKRWKDSEAGPHLYVFGIHLVDVRKVVKIEPADDGLFLVFSGDYLRLHKHVLDRSPGAESLFSGFPTGHSLFVPRRS